MPFLAAQSAIGTVACGSVKLVRTMYGEASVIDEVAAAVTTIGVLLWVAIGAAASASGVRPKPASTSTFSLTTSSCATRRVVSGTPASSLTISCTLRPAMLAPFCAIQSLAAASTCLPVDRRLAGHGQDEADLERRRIGGRGGRRHSHLQGESGEPGTD